MSETIIKVKSFGRIPPEYTGQAINNKGDRGWFRNGKLHSTKDNPAMILSNGTREWYQDGDVHRDGDHPAIILADGTNMWLQKGEFHREGDKPAVIWAGGRQEWWKHGKHHRQGDHPATISAEGTEEFWSHDQRHRTSGPAVIPPLGAIEKKEYWLNGVHMSKKEWELQTSQVSELLSPDDEKQVRQKVETSFDALSEKGRAERAFKKKEAIGKNEVSDPSREVCEATELMRRTGGGLRVRLLYFPERKELLVEQLYQKNGEIVYRQTARDDGMEVFHHPEVYPAVNPEFSVKVTKGEIEDISFGITHQKPKASDINLLQRSKPAAPSPEKQDNDLSL